MYLIFFFSFFLESNGKHQMVPKDLAQEAEDLAKVSFSPFFLCFNKTRLQLFIYFDILKPYSFCIPAFSDFLSQISELCLHNDYNVQGTNIFSSR